MENIFEPDNNFDFSKCSLGKPFNICKGTFFTKLFYKNKPFFIQTPKCPTKQGFIKNKKRYSCDLMFTNNDDIFINWIENLETVCHELLYEKGDEWFENKMEKSDIENTFQSPMKIFKSGRFYLLKTNIKNGIKIYDESNNIVSQEDITSNNNIISILEVQGIEFTSRNFQIEFEMKQSMIVSPDPFLDSCFIKRDFSSSSPSSSSSSSPSSKKKENESNNNDKISISYKNENGNDNDNDKKEKKEDEPDNFAEELINNYISSSSLPLQSSSSQKETPSSIKKISFNNSSEKEEKKEEEKEKKSLTKPKIRFSEETINNSKKNNHFSDDSDDDANDLLIIEDDDSTSANIEIECESLDLNVKKQNEEEYEKQYGKYIEIIEKSNTLIEETIKNYLEAEELMKKYNFNIENDKEKSKIESIMDYIELYNSRKLRV